MPVTLISGSVIIKLRSIPVYLLVPSKRGNLMQKLYVPLSRLFKNTNFHSFTHELVYTIYIIQRRDIDE